MLLYPLPVFGQSDHHPGLVSLPTPDAPTDHTSQMPGGVRTPGQLHAQRPARVPVTRVSTSLKKNQTVEMTLALHCYRDREYLGVASAHEDVRDVLGVASSPVEALTLLVAQYRDLQLAEDGGQGAAWQMFVITVTQY